MAGIHLLDCTLRDGGYCNQWNFGKKNISKIIQNLTNAGINIVECGFISNKIDENPNISKYKTIESISEIIPQDRHNCQYVAMMNYGEYDVDSLPPCDNTSIDGIRVAFHKKNLYDSLKICKRIKEKGYRVFVQAMVSMAYSDIEFLKMIELVNEFEPYAFYIVDSFGMMKNKDVMRYYSLVEHNLKKSIRIGFHSHNNMQLAYSNAQTIVNNRSEHEIIIDSSIYGMGRGAGNLNTELFIEYLNDNYQTKYVINPILETMDEIINEFYRISPWGYSLPNYLFAKHNTHPNYAGYLSDRNTLTIENMNEIIEMMDEDKRVEYNKQYIENLYLEYMKKGKDMEDNLAEFIKSNKNKKVLLIGPAKSSDTEYEKIMDVSKKTDIVTISVNFNYPHIQTDYIFVNNSRRFKEIDSKLWNRCIITSNVVATEAYMKIKYQTLINDEEFVRDNAGLMSVKMLINMGFNDILLAGFDGYSHNIKDNYANNSMTLITNNAIFDAMNQGMGKIFSKYSKIVNMTYITEPIYYKIE